LQPGIRFGDGTLKRLTIVAVALALTSLSSTARADIKDGPFGITMGANPTNYGCTSKDNDSFFTCDKLPRMHPDIQMYVVQSTSKTGICWVKGMSKEVETNSYGSALQVSTDKFSEQISNTYGSYSLDDNLLPGSIWNAPEDWMMGLSKNERFYTYKWDKTTNAKLKNGIERIYAAAHALSRDSGYVGIEFYFSNYKDCKNAEKDEKAGAF
jgi:hypothetical protein